MNLSSAITLDKSVVSVTEDTCRKVTTEIKARQIRDVTIDLLKSRLTVSGDGIESNMMAVTPTSRSCLIKLEELSVEAQAALEILVTDVLKIMGERLK
jgi:rRNA processing protein Krr1/Pno1